MWVQSWSTPLFWELKVAGPTKRLDPTELGQHFTPPYVFYICFPIYIYIYTCYPGCAMIIVLFQKELSCLLWSHSSMCVCVRVRFKFSHALLRWKQVGWRGPTAEPPGARRRARMQNVWQGFAISVSLATMGWSGKICYLKGIIKVFLSWP